MKLSVKLALLFCGLSITFVNTAINGQESSLSDGTIYKLAVRESGIYKLDAAYFQNNLSIDISQINPNQIQLFTDEGGMLDEKIANTQFYDPTELAIKVTGSEDGRFDTNDAVYFYSQGCNEFDWTENNASIKPNLYDNRHFVFLKINQNNGKRILTKQSESEFPSYEMNTTHKIYRHELERVNLLENYISAQGSGRMWFGESFSNNWNQDFSSFFTNISPIQGSESKVSFHFAARSESASKLSVDINGSSFDYNISGSSIGNVESIYAKTIIKSENIVLGKNPNIQFSYSPNDPSDNAWLDYIQIVTEEDIDINSSDYIFNFNNESNEYTAINFQELNVNNELWDVSKFNEVKQLLPDNTGNHVFRNGESPTIFYGFSPSQSKTPEFIGEAKNQNLKSEKSSELYIITAIQFLEAAERLAIHRSGTSGISTKVVVIDDIYNEFGSGRSDPTALRNFAKYQYDNNENFKYLLLFGDATYDFRHINDTDPNHNFVPTYQTMESLNPIEAFPTDDYFALLSDNEGGDINNSGGEFDGAVDISVGRIPVTNIDQANVIVDKILKYDTDPKTFGDWRLNVGFSADDEDSFGDQFLSQTEVIAKKTDTIDPLFNIQKVYFDAFVQESTPGGERYPTATQKLVENLFKGQLVLNYLGHGGPKGWSQERVFQIEDIQNLDNSNKMPLIVTATCSFTGFDNPNFVSAGEYAFLNNNGGAIALFTTVRSVYSNSNARITRAVFDNLFSKVEGQQLKLGDIIKVAKNSNSQDTLDNNVRKFALIGDPSMRLATPNENIILDKINDRLIDNIGFDTIRALDKVKIAGHIGNNPENVITSFNGKVFVTLFDKPKDVLSLGNNENNIKRSFKTQENILFKGSATVSNGKFELEFTLPKEINFNYGEGKISLYATNEVDNDAGGFYRNIIIGGSSATAIDDSEGPEIEIFLNDENFVSGGITDANPNLLVHLSDDLGINISSTSIGHDITGVLDDDTANPIKLNEFYQSTTDDSSSGTVNFPLRNLTVGLHKIRIKAWDITNNSSESELTFRVVDESFDNLEHVLNYPNPFTTNTNFSFEHRLAGGLLDIGVYIYTLSGKLVKTIETTRAATGYRIDDINWDGNDDFGANLAKGIYLYKIKVKDNAADIELESDFEKLVILK